MSLQGFLKGSHSSEVTVSPNSLRRVEDPDRDPQKSQIIVTRPSAAKTSGPDNKGAASATSLDSYSSSDPGMIEYIRTVPFFICIICHTYLLLDQIEITHTYAVRPEIRYPILATAIGCIIDNVRLALGNVLGGGSTSKALTYAAYFFHLVGLPSLFLTLGSFGESLYFYDSVVLRVLTPLSVVLTTTFMLDGIHSFFYKVMGNLVVDFDMGIIRYTLDPSKKSLMLILPAMLINLCSIILGVAILARFKESWYLIAQLVSFFGQALTPVLKNKGMYSSNVLEVLFLGSLIKVQSYI